MLNPAPFVLMLSWTKESVALVMIGAGVVAVAPAQDKKKNSEVANTVGCGAINAECTSSKEMPLKRSRSMKLAGPVGATYAGRPPGPRGVVVQEAVTAAVDDDDAGTPTL